MKIYINSVIKTLGCCILSLLFPACVVDDTVQYDAPANEAYILVTVKMPQPSLTTTRSDTQAETESQISTLRVLVMEDNGSGYRFSYQVIGNEMEPSGNLQRFRVLLRATGTPLKLLILINAEQVFTSYLPVEGDLEADVKSNLEIPFTSAGLTGYLPMYSELLLGSGVNVGNNSVQVTALRSVARVDVVKDLEIGSDDFVLEEVLIYRANDNIKVDHEAFADPNIPVVSTPSVPADAAILSTPISKMVADGADEIRYIYLPESNAAENDFDKLDGTPVIIVGGRWGGSGNPITYYRADFYPELSDVRFGQVLRNHLYTINIKKVSAPGWDTPEEAANNLSSSIVVDVQAWEDFSSDVYFGENRFAISSREISLRYTANRTRQLDVESTLEYQIVWLDANGVPSGTAISQPGSAIANDVFEVSIVKDNSDPEAVTHLAFRTLANNYTGNVIERTLRITVDNWSVDITVRQDNTSVYSTRHFNVLSGIDTGSYSAGNLGTTTTLPPGYAGGWSYGGLAMRKILDVHFAPAGEVGIGGFAFDQVDDTNSHLSTTSGTNLQEMERIIRMQNVIYLAYSVNLSNEVANIILNWLAESPRRVLILGCDDATTNANLRNKALISSDGAWSFNITSGSYSRANATSETTEFFSGPFGNVNQAPIARFDDTAGYMAIPASGVTSLITANNGGMVFGVNKQKRIVYHGDANLFLRPQLTDETGSVTNDLDRLMANVWAWIVEQLIYGDE